MLHQTQPCLCLATVALHGRSPAHPPVWQLVHSEKCCQPCGFNQLRDGTEQALSPKQVAKEQTPYTSHRPEGSPSPQGFGPCKFQISSSGMNLWVWDGRTWRTLELGKALGMQGWWVSAPSLSTIRRGERFSLARWQGGCPLALPYPREVSAFIFMGRQPKLESDTSRDLLRAFLIAPVHL